ncbi:acyltransferase family protein [Pseudactinotalea suaedae]|uniref:acyltransferase family protein n=1 Tax=Pseudactinotalea suaedae TaxID=1524924 RepID=UPI0012E2C13B|nr:acyltransferase family protein [Pseudactinotalea suaedae]
MTSATTAPDTAVTATQRIHGLDALRAGALGLGIVLHSLMPFLSEAVWLFNDRRTTPVAGAVVDWIHLFRMVLFMALAGYFGRMVLQRRGTARYLKDRLLRIGLPAVAFWPVAVASTFAIVGVGMAMRGQELPPAAESAEADPLLLFTPAHLWFLWVLIEAVLITVLARAVLLRVLGDAAVGRAAERIGQALSSPWGVLVAVPPYAACLLAQGSTVAGIREHATIVPSVTALTAYLGAFLVGWFLQARAGSLHWIARYWPVQLALAVVLTVALRMLTDAAAPLLVLATTTALGGWTWTFALIGLSVRFLYRERPVVRYLADASYWSYLLHLPILLAVGLALADTGLPIIVKLVITWVVTGALLLGSYDLFVRSTWIGRWLNGYRHPRAWQRMRRSREVDDHAVSRS